MNTSSRTTTHGTVMILNFIWTFFLSLAMVETIVYFVALVNLKQGSLDYLSFVQMLMKEGQNSLKVLDVVVIFILLWFVALKSLDFPFLKNVKLQGSVDISGPTDTSGFVAPLISAILAIALTHFISRFVLDFRSDSWTELVIPTMIGLILSVVGNWATRYLASEKILYLCIWMFIFVVLIRFFVRNDAFPSLNLNDIGWLKDFVLMTIIFILGSILYPSIEEFLTWERPSIIMVVVGIVIVALAAALLDIYFPGSPGGEVYCKRLLTLQKIELSTQNIEDLRAAISTHVLFRTVILLFSGVVAPFVLYVLSELLKRRG